MQSDLRCEAIVVRNVPRDDIPAVVVDQVGDGDIVCNGKASDQGSNNDTGRVESLL